MDERGAGIGKTDIANDIRTQSALKDSNSVFKPLDDIALILLVAHTVTNSRLRCLSATFSLSTSTISASIG